MTLDCLSPELYINHHTFFLVFYVHVSKATIIHLFSSTDFNIFLGVESKKRSELFGKLFLAYLFTLRIVSCIYNSGQYKQTFQHLLLQLD